MAELLNCAPHPAAILLFMGTIPIDVEGLQDPELLLKDLQNPEEWKSVPYTSELCVSLLDEIVEGLVVEDPSFPPALARAVGLIE